MDQGSEAVSVGRLVIHDPAMGPTEVAIEHRAQAHCHPLRSCLVERKQDWIAVSGPSVDGADLPNHGSDDDQLFDDVSLPSTRSSADDLGAWSKFASVAACLKPRHVPYLEQLLLTWVDESMPRLDGAPAEEVVRQCVEVIPEAIVEAVRIGDEQPVESARCQEPWTEYVSAAVHELAKHPWPRIAVLEILQPSIVDDWQSGRADMSSDERGGAAWVFMFCSLLQLEGDESVPPSVIDALGYRLEHPLW